MNHVTIVFRKVYAEDKSCYTLQVFAVYENHIDANHIYVNAPDDYIIEQHPVVRRINRPVDSI